MLDEKAKNDSIAENFLKYGRLFIDASSKKIKLGDSEVLLTKSEYLILLMLASNPLRLYSSRQIIDAIWGSSGGNVTEHTIESHIANIRKKLGHDSCCVHNRKGFGYEFDPCTFKI
jgi:DNA-binding response OmpR family regulator